MKEEAIILKTSSNKDYKLWYFDLLTPLAEDKQNWKKAKIKVKIYKE